MADTMLNTPGDCGEQVAKPNTPNSGPRLARNICLALALIIATACVTLFGVVLAYKKPATPSCSDKKDGSNDHVRAPDPALPAKLEPDGAVPSPTGTIDLSLPPKLRWQLVTQEVVRRHGFEHTFAPLLAVINRATPGVPVLAAWMKKIIKTRFPIYYEELEGIVQTLHGMNYTEHGVTMEAFAVWQWLSEISNINTTSPSGEEHLKHIPFGGKACTSLVTRTKNGTILHARNDDASASHFTTNLTVDVNFVTNGRITAKAVVFVGWAGTFTSLVPGVASLTEDQKARFGPMQKWSQKDYMAMIDASPSAGPVGIIMRQAMIDNGGGAFGAFPPPSGSSFNGVLSYLNTAPVGQPAYWILAGTANGAGDEGAVISRNLTVAMQHNHTLRLGQTTAWVPFDWALVQTNWEYWKPLPFPQFDPRRTVLVDHFKAVGRDTAASMDGLLKALSIPTKTAGANGVLNVATIFSVIMVPGNGTLQSYLRHSTGCCG